MRRTATITLAAALAALALGACQSSTKGAQGGGTPTGAPTTTAATSTPTPTPTPVASPTESAVATALDPCQVVPAAEASQLAGTHYTSGKEETTGTANGGKLCVYGSQTTNVFEVEVAQAADAQTADSDWDTYRSQLNGVLAKAAQGAPGLTINFTFTDVSGLTDKAATGKFSSSIQGVTISGSGFYLIKGATFVAFDDLQVGSGVPSAADLTAEAQTVVGRLP